jgi:3D (Asp-Asp-Asp) domain-containing protein
MSKIYLSLFWRYTPFVIIIVILLVVLAPVARHRQSLTLAAEATADSSGIDYTVCLRRMEVLYPPPSSLQLPPPVLYERRLMRVTAYCPCKKCCGSYAAGITASGHKIGPGESFVAAPPELPFGTTIHIPGYNKELPVQVLDRGGAIQDDHLDVFFADHQAARQWGVQYLIVTIETPDPTFVESSPMFISDGAGLRSGTRNAQSPTVEWKSVPSFESREQ